jgi:hypothetical protein
MEEQRDSPGCTMYDIGHAHFLLAHTVGVFGGYRRTAGCHLQHRFRPGASSAAALDSESALHFHPAGNHPMIPHVIVLEPGLVIYKVYNRATEM